MREEGGGIRDKVPALARMLALSPITLFERRSEQ
jgi:hypothetical protein